MYLLYLDESGSASDPNQKFFVLAGIAVFERSTHWIDKALQEISSRFANYLEPHEIELHGYPMRSGRKMTSSNDQLKRTETWKKFPLTARMDAIKDALRLGVSDQYRNGAGLFGAVIRKDALEAKDPVEFAFEQIVSRFDYFLR